MIPNTEGDTPQKSNLPQEEKGSKIPQDHEPTPRSSTSGVGGGRARAGTTESAPLQFRACFLQNWSWEIVTQLNRRLCEGKGSQYGFRGEDQEACREKWERIRQTPLTLLEVYDALRDFHRRAPFLFFNGNTFAEIGRTLSKAVFADLPIARLTNAASAVAHYVAGVLEREDMENVLTGVMVDEKIGVGDNVESLKGSMRGLVIKILDDNRLLIQAEGRTSTLICTPDTLKKRISPSTSTGKESL